MTRPQTRQSATSRVDRLAELATLEVDGLFGRYEHRIAFPHVADATDPALLIIHGPNGVGKTTILQMLDGLIRLDFDIFRVRPFTRAVLTLTNGLALVVSPDPDGQLLVTFDNHQVVLDAKRKGAANPAANDAVSEFRSAFFEAILGVSFTLVTTTRTPVSNEGRASTRYDYDAYALAASRSVLEDSPSARLSARLRLGPPEDESTTLSAKVRRFVRDAQVDYRQFFSTDLSLYSQVLEILKSPERPSTDVNQLTKDVALVHSLDRAHRLLGLNTEAWNYRELSQFLKSLKGAPGRGNRDWALPILGSYVRGLLLRAQERDLIAARLRRFEDSLNSFLLDKRVTLTREGFQIEAPDGHPLGEAQLSSGEFHLLYLTVAALVAQRRGTVIAIDEPELSMHTAWQRKLIQHLLHIASDASPLLVLATHSPDVVGSYREHLVPIGATEAI